MLDIISCPVGHTPAVCLDKTSGSCWNYSLYILEILANNINFTVFFTQISDKPAGFDVPTAVVTMICQIYSDYPVKILRCIATKVRITKSISDEFAIRN
jgi:hypothetical protein